MEKEQELCFLIGPTAAGKSDWALELAEGVGGAICSLDSMLVYRGMDIGTAKPSPADRARVPHYCIDRVEPPERYDARRYLEDVAEAQEDARAAGRRLLFVGGTGFYLKLLIHGLFDGPPADPVLRESLKERARNEGLQALVAELVRVDPVAAERIHSNDQKRVLRALEVFHQTGHPLSEHQREWGGQGERRPTPHRIVGVQRPAEVLEERIRGRTSRMLAAGWSDEVARIRDTCGFGPTSIQALGYREVLALLEGELNRRECEEKIALRTRQFARRQRTWWRSFDVQWIDPTQRGGIGRARESLGW